MSAGLDFEAGSRRLIPAVLVYARCQGHLLMIHRDAELRPGDFHAGKWNGLGGKLEVDESSAEAARREFKEESGISLNLDQFKPLGVLQFPNFKPQKFEDWVVWVFEVELAELMQPPRCDEGSLHWVREEDLLSLNLWPGDRHFIPYVLQRRPMQGTIWYRDGKVDRASVTTL